MARYRVGPVRFGGGRRVSVGVHVGPVGATFGGRRRRSGGSGGGGSSYSGSYGGMSAAEERQQQREIEKKNISNVIFLFIRERTDFLPLERVLGKI